MASHLYSYDGHVSFHNYDEHVRKIQMKDMTSLVSLVKYLEEPIQKGDPLRNIYIARSCLVWLSVMIEWSNKATFPKEILDLVDEDAVSAISFSTLCQSAGVVCELVIGKCRDLHFVPGETTFEELPQAAWNSFQCGKTWHLVCPDFAIRTVSGYSRGNEIILQVNEEAKFQTTKANKGYTSAALVDFWFCTRPDIFVNYAFPDDPAWQLTKPRPIDKSDFDDRLYRSPGFFMAKLVLLSEDKSVLYSKKGRSTITIGADKALMSSLRFNYTLSFVQGTGELSSANKDDLPRLVVYARAIDTVEFTIRFPVTGHYMFKVAVVSPGLVTNNSCLECRLICTEVNPQWNKPIPIDPGDEGFGFNHVAKTIGLSHPSKKTATVTVQNINEVPGSGGEVLKFKIDQDRVDELEFSSDIVEDQTGNGSKAMGYARTRVDRATGDLSIETGLTREGECALVVNAREKRPGSVFRRVMNFLVSSHENDEEEHAKSVEDKKKKLVLSKKREQKEGVKQTITEHIDETANEIEEIKRQLELLDAD